MSASEGMPLLSEGAVLCLAEEGVPAGWRLRWGEEGVAPKASELMMPSRRFDMVTFLEFSRLLLLHGH